MAEFQNAGELLAKQIAAQPSVLEQTQQALSLVDLGNKIQAAPAELRAKEADARLKEDQVNQLDVQHMLAQADLDTKRGTEFRAQKKFMQDQLLSVHDTFLKNPEVGGALLSYVYGGKATSEKNKDGTYTLTVPGGDGTFKSFIADPNRVASPETRAGMETTLRTEYGKATEPYRVRYLYGQNLEKLLAQGTGAADMAAVYAFVHTAEPNSAVQQGEQITAAHAPGLSQRIIDQYNLSVQAVKEGKTPSGAIFGPPGSTARKEMIAAAKAMIENSRKTAVNDGQFFFQAANNERLNTRNVLGTVGDITAADFEPKPTVIPTADELLKNAAGTAPPPPGVGARGPEQITPNRSGAGAPAQSATPPPGVPSLAPPPPAKPRYNLRNQTGAFIHRLQNKGVPQ